MATYVNSTTLAKHGRHIAFDTRRFAKAADDANAWIFTRWIHKCGGDQWRRAYSALIKGDWPDVPGFADDKYLAINDLGWSSGPETGLPAPLLRHVEAFCSKAMPQSTMPIWVPVVSSSSDVAVIDVASIRKAGDKLTFWSRYLPITKISNTSAGDVLLFAAEGDSLTTQFVADCKAHTAATAQAHKYEWKNGARGKSMDGTIFSDPKFSEPVPGSMADGQLRFACDAWSSR